jgi:hypothetical protein
MFGETVTDMRASGGLAYGMETALISFLMETSILGNTDMGTLMVSGSTNGKMEIHMQESSLMV